MAARTANNKVQKKRSSYRLLVSACLAGISCTYSGKSNARKLMKALVDKRLAFPVCPEVLGGLPIPRDNAEICGGDGHDVLRNGPVKVLTITGTDVSKNFIKGSRKALSIAHKYKIRCAILKSRSPACGRGLIYDGTFTRAVKRGDGVLAALLQQNGIKVYTEKEAFHAKRGLLQRN